MNNSANEQSHNTPQMEWNLIFAGWLVAVMATLVSLFFSEVMALQPCALCWYQRIVMYPLMVILLIALFSLDLRVIRYALPLAVIPHLLLIIGFIGDKTKPASSLSNLDRRPRARCFGVARHAASLRGHHPVLDKLVINKSIWYSKTLPRLIGYNGQYVPSHLEKEPRP